MDFDPRDYDSRDDDAFRLTDITEEKGIPTTNLIAR